MKVVLKYVLILGQNLGYLILLLILCYTSNAQGRLIILLYLHNEGYKELFIIFLLRLLLELHS